MPAWLLPALMAGGQLLGKAAGGASKEREGQNNFQLQQNQLNQSAHQSNQSNLLNAMQQNEMAKLQRAKLGIEAPQARTKQALLGSLLQNARTARYTPPRGIRMGQVSGGFDLDALINALGRKAGGTLQSQAISALESGSDVPAYEDATARLTQAPTPGGYKKAGTLESVLSGAGLLSGLLGGIGGAVSAGRRPGIRTDGTV